MNFTLPWCVSMRRVARSNQCGYEGFCAFRVALEVSCHVSISLIMDRRSTRTVLGLLWGLCFLMHTRLLPILLVRCSFPLVLNRGIPGFSRLLCGNKRPMPLMYLCWACASRLWRWCRCSVSIVLACCCCCPGPCGIWVRRRKRPSPFGKWAATHLVGWFELTALLSMSLRNLSRRSMVGSDIYISGSACSTVGVHSQAWSTAGIGRLGSKSGRG
jgi:hypothetical protein